MKDIRKESLALLLLFVLAVCMGLAGCEAKDLPEADLAAGAEKYLTGAGMNEQDIHALLERIQ